MLKKLYSVPVILSHQVIRFETIQSVTTACGDTDHDGYYSKTTGIYHEYSESPDQH